MRDSVLAVFGSSLSDRAWSQQVWEAILDAIENCLDGSHPHQAEHDALAAEVLEAATQGEKLPYPVEGWAYWFGDDGPFWAYERARKFGIF